jgi:ribonuclease BN (tRNA processing enzyme)
MELRDYFEIVPLRWEEEHVLGPFRIRLRRTLHHVPTCAVRVQAAGRTFAYSSDTAFDPSLIDFLSSADLIVHETNFGPAHTPYEKLAELPEPLRRRMRLIHFPDEFDRASSAVVPLDEGEWLAV